MVDVLRGFILVSSMLFVVAGLFVRPYDSILLCLFDYVNNKNQRKAGKLTFLIKILSKKKRTSANAPFFLNPINKKIELQQQLNLISIYNTLQEVANVSNNICILDAYGKSSVLTAGFSRILMPSMFATDSPHDSHSRTRCS